MDAYSSPPEVIEATSTSALVRARLSPPHAGWAVEARANLGLVGSRIAEIRIVIDDDRVPARDERHGGVAGLTSKLLRAIAIDPLEVAAGSAMRRIAMAKVDQLEAEMEAEGTFERPTATKKSGRPPLSPEHHRRVALAYLELQAAGTGRGIIGKLAERFEVTPTKASDWVHRARKAGYLSAAIPGRPGAHPGPALTRKDEA